MKALNIRVILHKKNKIVKENEENKEEEIDDESFKINSKNNMNSKVRSKGLWNYKVDCIHFERCILRLIKQWKTSLKIIQILVRKQEYSEIFFFTFK